MVNETTIDKINLVGYASGLGGVDLRCGTGPLKMQESIYLKDAIQSGLPYVWHQIIKPELQKQNDLTQIAEVVTKLAASIKTLVNNQKKFVVLGGDHTSAIGTWSGVQTAKKSEGPIGLIWIDAHMDSHTPSTSLSGRIHGMPLAVLLGKGYDELVNINESALNVANVCLIGVRSFESGEQHFLESENVRIYYMNEVKERGFTSVLNEAIKQVTNNTIGYGVSLDLDGLDPEEAPGVDVPEPDGIKVSDILGAIETFRTDKKCLGLEIVEFDPARDIEHETEKLVVQLLSHYATSALK